MTRFRSLRFLFVIVCMAVLMQPVAAIASWQSGGTKTGTVTATRVLPTAAPSVVQVGLNVRLAWTASTLVTGQAVEGYEVRRRVAAGPSVVICTTVAPTRTCDDTSPSTSTVGYGVVAIYRNWRSQESALTSYTHDASGPVTTVTSNPVPNGADWNNSAVTLTLNATDSAGVANVAYRIGSGSWVTALGSSVSIPASADGTTTVTYQATDSFGNVENARTYDVKIDTVAPTAMPASLAMSNDTGASTTDGITNNPSQTVSGTAPAGSLVNIRVGGTVVATATAAANGTFSSSLPVLPGDGLHNVSARVVDLAGNEGPTASFGITLDTVAPTTLPAGLAISADTGASASDGITNQTTQTLSATAPAGSVVNVRVGATLVATVTASAGGTITSALPVLTGDGLHTVTARVVDLAGNEGPTASFGIKLDRTAPAGGVSFPQNGQSYSKGAFKNGCNVAPWYSQDALCGTASDASPSGLLDQASIRLVRSSDSQCWTGAGTPIFSAAACGALPTTPITGTTSPVWQTVTGELPSGGYVLTVTVRDLAGNSTTLSSVSFSR